MEAISEKDEKEGVTIDANMPLVSVKGVIIKSQTKHLWQLLVPRQHDNDIEARSAIN